MTHPSESLEGTPLIAPSTVNHALFDAIVEACRSVYDPEIPVNIYDLGLIYTIDITDDNDVKVIMTLTAPGCPVAGDMPGWIVDAVSPCGWRENRRCGTDMGTALGHGDDVRRGAARIGLYVTFPLLEAWINST